MKNESSYNNSEASLKGSLKSSSTKRHVTFDPLSKPVQTPKFTETLPSPAKNQRQIENKLLSTSLKQSNGLFETSYRLDQSRKSGEFFKHDNQANEVYKLQEFQTLGQSRLEEVSKPIKTNKQSKLTAKTKKIEVPADKRIVSPLETQQKQISKKNLHIETKQKPVQLPSNKQNDTPIIDRPQNPISVDITFKGDEPQKPASSTKKAHLNSQPVSVSNIDVKSSRKTEQNTSIKPTEQKKSNEVYSKPSQKVTDTKPKANNSLADSKLRNSQNKPIKPIQKSRDTEKEAIKKSSPQKMISLEQEWARKRPPRNPRKPPIKIIPEIDQSTYNILPPSLQKAPEWLLKNDKAPPPPPYIKLIDMSHPAHSYPIPPPLSMVAQFIAKNRNSTKVLPKPSKTDAQNNLNSPTKTGQAASLRTSAAKQQYSPRLQTLKQDSNQMDLLDDSQISRVTNRNLDESADLLRSIYEFRKSTNFHQQILINSRTYGNKDKPQSSKVKARPEEDILLGENPEKSKPQASLLSSANFSKKASAQPASSLPKPIIR